MATVSARERHHGALPETDDKPKHLAVQINRALGDLLLAYPESLLFGEDVGKKGGVLRIPDGEMWRRSLCLCSA